MRRMSSFRRLLFPALAIGIAILAAAMVAGCGDSDSDADQPAASSEPSQAYTQLLAGLKKAALAGEGYKAIRKANSLPNPEESVVDAFCETVWQLDVNAETEKLARHSYILGRIRSFAELNMGVAYVPGRAELPEVAKALDELDTTFDIASFDAQLNDRYKRACNT